MQSKNIQKKAKEDAKEEKKKKIQKMNLRESVTQMLKTTDILLPQ